MSRDPMAGKYVQWFKNEFAMAQLVLNNARGALHWSDNDYEAFRFESPDVTLVFYPHTTSGTGNVSCRVRDQGSRKKGKADRLMALLYIASGHNNTFSRKGMDLNWVGDIARREKLEYGWAERSLT